MANEPVSKIAQLTDKDGVTNLYPYTVPDAIVGLEDYVKEHTPTDTYTLPVASPTVLGGVKPITKSSDMTQSVGVDSQGGLWVPPAATSGGSGKRTCRFVIGTSTAGWTADDCDYLCDGISDQSEFLSAISALPSTGGEIVILDGTYIFSSALNITKANVIIRGNGSSTIVKRNFNNSYTPTGSIGVIVLSAHQCALSNIAIDGDKSSHPGQYHYGIIANANNLSINHCYIKDCGGSGIYIYGTDNSFISFNRCINCANGISGASGTSTCLCITNNFVSGNETYGITADSSCMVSNNSAIKNKDGILLSGAAPIGSVVSGNYVSDNTEYGILLSTHSATVTNNTSIANKVANLFVNAASQYNVVSSNVFYRYTVNTPPIVFEAKVAGSITPPGNNLIIGNIVGGQTITSPVTSNTIVNNK